MFPQAILFVALTGASFASVTVNVTNANWYFSPYNTISDGAGALQANNVKGSSTLVTFNGPGSYFKTNFTGTSFVLNVTESQNTSPFSIVMWTVDNKAFTSHSLNGSETTITVATGLSNTTHTLQFFLQSRTDGGAAWSTNPPPDSIVINSATLDTAASLSAPTGEIAIRSKNCLFYGDSITEGVETVSLGGPPANHNALWAYPGSVAKSIGCEYGQVGWAGQGFSQGGNGGVPSFPSAWDSYLSGVSRLVGGKLSPIPDAVFVNQGTNDGSTNIISTVQTWLTNVRAAVNSSTPIILMIPFNQAEQANLTTAKNNQGDAFVYILDLGLAYSYGLAGAASQYSYDGTHPNLFGSEFLVSGVLQALRLAGGSIIGGAVVISGGGTLR